MSHNESRCDAAYRDGLLQGELVAARGSANRPGIGRWSGAVDRAHFVLGYERGYAAGARVPTL